MLILLFLFTFVQSLEVQNNNEFRINTEGAYIENDDIFGCESGYYCPGDGKKYQCPDGYYSIFRDKECTKCGCKKSKSCIKATKTDNKTGITVYAGQCQRKSPCIKGYGYDKETNTCLKCKGQRYSEGGYNECKRCRVHEIVSKELDRCIECPPGKISIANIFCFPCKKGTFYNNETKTCEFCEEGYYNDKYGQFSCQKCPDGMYSSVYKVVCLNYKQNFFEYIPLKYWEGEHYHPPRIEGEEEIVDEPMTIEQIREMLNNLPKRDENN